jgi:diadenylate cyclase
VWDVIDIALIAYIIYRGLRFIRETRAEQLLKGFLLLLVITVASGILHLYALNWILVGVMNFGVIALVVVFQPELRRALEHLGRTRFMFRRFSAIEKDRIKQATSGIVDAVDQFSATKTGALIIMEREISLTDFAETGTMLSAEVSPELLENIFFEGSPLHDGAVIIRDGRVYAAGCVLPLTRNKALSKKLGTRHRAGIGVTEVSDCMAIIVSEETGIISTAFEGVLTRFLDIRTLEKEILNMYFGDASPGKESFTEFFRRIMRVSKQ